MLMLNANATLESDSHVLDMINSLDLLDLHSSHPTPSTYIGSSNRRIDYIFGCPHIKAVSSRYSSSISIRSNLAAHCLFRPLRKGNPELVGKHVAEMQVYYTRHKIKERIDKLHETHSSLSREVVRNLLTSWDNDQGRAMLAAERTLQIAPKPHR